MSASLYVQGLEGLQHGTSFSCSPDAHARSVQNEEKGPNADKASSKRSNAGHGIQRGDSAQQDNARKSSENARKSSETPAADADMQAWQSKLSFMRQQVKGLPWIAEMVRTFEHRHIVKHTLSNTHRSADIRKQRSSC